MAWSRLDDGLDEHPKVDVLLEDDELRGLAAVGLWALTLANSARRLTDGQVTGPTLRKIAPRHGKALAERLVDAGLYDDHDDQGLVIHDYLDFNPSRESVEEKRRKDSERKAAGRSGRSPQGIPPDSSRTGARNPNGQATDVRAESARPVPEPIPKGRSSNVAALRQPPSTTNVSSIALSAQQNEDAA